MRIRIRMPVKLVGCVALSLLATTTHIYAAGFFVPTKGAVGIGSAHIGNTARASDASTVFYNPAGMVGLEGRTIQGGVDFISPDFRLADTGSTATTLGTGGAAAPFEGTKGRAGDLTPLPNLYFASPLSNDDFWLGVALTAPFGLSLDYDDDWFGRYDSIKNKLNTIDLAPSFAYKFNDSWSIGAGINIQYADAKLGNALPNPFIPGGPTVATDGYAEVDGDDWDLGFNVGLLYRSNATQIGLHYRSGMSHKLGGKTEISGLTGPLEAANGISGSTTGLDLPAIASLALTYDLTESWKVLAELNWFDWSAFDEIRIEFDNGTPDNVRPQGYKDTLTGGIGLEYALNPKWTLRSGIQFDESPAVDEYRNTSIPDSDQVWFGLGASYRSSDRLTIDLGYVHSNFDSANINLTSTFFAGTPVAGTVNTVARTNVKVNVFSFDIRYRF